MRSRITLTTVIFLLAVIPFEGASAAINPDSASRLPRELKAQIINTLDSTNLRVKNVKIIITKGHNQSSAQSWDYQSPNRAESIPRRIFVSKRHFGIQVEVGNTVVFHYSIGQMDLDGGVKVIPGPEFIGFRLDHGMGRWTNVQNQLFAPLLDALDGNRYVHTSDTYVFSTRRGIKGSVTVRGRRVVSAQITFFQSSCSGDPIKYQEFESFYGVEHFEKVVLPPSSEIQLSKSGEITQENTNDCK